MSPALGRFGAARRALRIPLLLGALLALFYAPLADPQAALATRDMVELHLPLRATFARLADSGLPQWDPFAHGGQPLLSNPSYGALYPLSWLVLLLPTALAINLLVLLHAALAAWGAFRLARQLGAHDATAVLAALAYACGPTYLALLHTLNIALAMSLLPWTMAFALALLDPRPEDRRRGAVLGLTAALTAIFVLGDPLVVAMTLLAVAAFVLAKPRQRLPRLPRLAGACAVAVGLAAVQIVPTLARLAESPRGGGLAWQQATVWSLPWQRFAELVFPRVFGDAAQPELALYFGWGIHDRDYPLLLWIAIGLPLLLLAAASWTRRDAPERGSWVLMTLAGLFFAFGRFNPLYRWAWTYLPGVDKVRYPEKFLLLALTAAIFAGALGWQRLLDQRATAEPLQPLQPAEPLQPAPAGGRRWRSRVPAAGLPVVLAALLAGLAGGATLLAFGAPQGIAAFAGAHSGMPLAGEALARAIDFYRRESLMATGFALATLVLFGLAGGSRAPRRALEAAALALVALELWTYGHALVRTLPAGDLLAPPQLVRDLAAPAGRLFSNEPYRRDRTELVVTAGDPRLRWARAPIERLDPRAGNLFGLAYALDRDFDLSLTRPAARAVRLYEQIRADPELELRLLGAWGVSHLIERKPASVLVDEARRAGPARAATVAPVSARANGLALPLYRFVAAAEVLPDAAAAERAAIAARLPLQAVEYLIGDLAAPGEGAPALRALLAGRLDDARLGAVEDRGDRVRLRYSAARPALLVAATTFDSRWQARVGAVGLPLFETAAGYMAIVVPPGEGEVELRFRDPWLSLGAAISATTLLVGLLLWLRSRRLAAAGPY